MVVTRGGQRADIDDSDGACAERVAQTVSQTPAGVEMFGVGKDPQELADKAEAHCQQYGLDAQMKNVRLGDGGLERWETFDCVKTNGSVNTDNKSTSK